MRPMLDKLELPHVQEIATIEKRVLAEHKPPGMAGSLLQNLGRRPTRLVLWGVASGPEAFKFTEDLESKFRDAKPLPFAADIIADAEIDQMVIDDLRVQELAGKPQRYAYVMTLREFIKPVEPADVSALDGGLLSGLDTDLLSGLDTSILDEAKGLVDDLVAGLDIGQAFATGLEQFVSTFSDLLGRVQAANH